MFSFEFFKWISILVAIICVIVVLYMRYLARNDDYWKKRGVPYAPRINIFTIMRKFSDKAIHESVLENAKKYGKVFGTFEFSKPVLSIADPDLLRDILVKDFNVFSYRREMKTGDPITDKMVSILRDDDWKRVRTIITPAFTSKRMREMSSVINECSKSIGEVFGKHAETGEAIDCRGIFSAFTMDVIASAAFGTKIDSYNDPNNEFVQNAKKSFVEFSMWKVILFNFLPSILHRYVGTNFFSSNDFFASVTRTVIKKRKEKGERYNDVLQILMDAVEENANSKNAELNVDEEDKFGSIVNEDSLPPLRYKAISEDELLAQCVLFFFVGYETSASTLTFVAYNLATNPEWQEKVIAEIDKAFEKNSEMSYDCVRDMKMLEAVVSETLRMFPVLTVSERTATKEYKLGNTGITVEKGMTVAFPIYAIHMDPDHFEEPEKFDPTRFLDSGNPKHHPYAYLPFGAGPRNCLGMRFALLEMKLCIANILRHYRLRLHPTAKVPLDFRKRYPFLSLSELPLSVERRTDVQI